jgi:stearoyl-CoA desaturase (delta-9 desaturase)
MDTSRKLDWTNILFLSLTPVIGVFGTLAYALVNGVEWWQPALLVVLFMLVSFSVTAGYHRGFSHKSYKAHPVLQAYYLFFGALALQNSVLKWSADHRDHHRYVDRDWDPYSIKRGGLWAHFFWLFYTDGKERSYDEVPDLTSNRMVMWQYRWSHWIGIVGGLGIPTAIGWAFGSPLGGLLWGGFLRIALIHHTTFLVNSVAHLYGTRPYTDENSARDNALLAFVTNGEGYHNFHHKFPSDFRNGIRWYQWDPTKWFIGVLRVVGLARELRVTPKAIIEKSKLRMKLVHAEERLALAPSELGAAVRMRMESAHRALDRASAVWHELDAKRREMVERGRRRSAELAHSLEEMVVEYKAALAEARRQWRRAAKLLSRIPEPV